MQPRRLTAWHTAEGLPTAVITAVIQDNDGFVWAGTHVGLARTDGEHVEVFRPRRGDPTTLVGAAVYDGALLKGSDGSVWVGTSRGVCRRRPAATAFECVSEYAGGGSLDGGSSSGGSANGEEADDEANVLALAEAPDGAVWVGTMGGLYRVSPATMEAVRIPDEAGLPHPVVLSVGALGDGTLWVGTYGGLAVRRAGEDRFRFVDLPPGSYVTAIEPAASGVWLGTYGNGLFRLRESAPSRVDGVRALPRYDVAPVNFTAGLASAAGPFPPEAGPHFIRGLHEDGAGRLWIATWGGGLFRYDPTSGRTAHHTTRAPPALDGGLTAGGFPSDQVVDVEVDADGGVWAATWDGLAYLPPPRPYRLLAHEPTDPASLSDDRVTSLLVHPDGSLWVGTFGGGLNRCDPSTLACERFRADPDDPRSLCHDIVLDLDLGPDASVWVATSGSGVCRYDGAAGAFAPALPHAPGLRNAHVYAVEFGARGRVWLGTATDGLHGVPLEASGSGGGSGQAAAVSALPGQSVYALARTAAGELLAGTFGAGLCRGSARSPFTCGAQDSPAAPRPDGAPDGATDRAPEGSGTMADWITAVTLDRGGAWVGHVTGLHWMPEEGGGWGVPDPVFDGATVSAPQVACVLPAASGVWVSTFGGILRVDPDTREVAERLAARGFPAEGFLRGACAEVGPDLLAFGTQDGVILFRPSDVAAPLAAPTLLTGILADGRPVAPETPAHRLRSFTLGPGQSGPTFRFATMNYPALEHRRYVYRLDGLDEGWSRPTDRPEVTYPRLPAGRYTFRVRPAGEPGAREAAVAFTVLAPVWRRPWFVALALLAALAVGAALYRARVGYLLEVERTRKAIADDLHDDIGSRISGLALSLDVSAQTVGAPAVDSPDDWAVREELAERAAEARELASDLRDTVWIVDAEYDTVAKLVDRAQDAARRLLPGGRVDVEASGRTDWPLSMAQRRHLFFLCKEALHNAARHGRPGAVRIDADVSEAGRLQLVIEDDGHGFDPEGATGPPGRGLSTMRDRAAALGGHLRIESTPGEGTRVRLRLDLAQKRRWRPPWRPG